MGRGGRGFARRVLWWVPARYLGLPGLLSGGGCNGCTTCVPGGGTQVPPSTSPCTSPLQCHLQADKSHAGERSKLQQTSRLRPLRDGSTSLVPSAPSQTGKISKQTYYVHPSHQRFPSPAVGPRTQIGVGEGAHPGTAIDKSRRMIQNDAVHPSRPL